MCGPSTRTRRVVASGLAAVIGLSLTGCAPRAAAPVVGPAPTTTPATTETPTGAPTVVPSTLAERVSPAPSVESAGIAGSTSAPWRLLAIAADGRTITVRANQGSGCDEPRGMEVVERKDEVELSSLVEHTTPPSGVSCLAFLRTPLWAIHLAEPLGGRRLVNAPASGAMP